MVFYPSDMGKILSMGLDYGSLGSSVIDYLFRRNNKGWQGIDARPVIIISSEQVID
jgi:hypothetical protein